MRPGKPVGLDRIHTKQESIKFANKAIAENTV